MLSTTSRWVIADETPITMFPDGVHVRHMIISPDLRHVAYIVDTGDCHRVVVDDRVDPPCVSVDTLRFSNVGNHVSYIAKLPDATYCMVKDGVFGKAYEDITSYGFSPDGVYLVYEAISHEDIYLVLDSQEHGPYDMVVPWSPAWSADSRHFAYEMQDAEGIHVILDGQVSKAWEIVEGTQFHPANGQLIYLATSKDLHYVVFGDQVITIPEDFLSDLVCHPTATQFAFQSLTDDGVCICVPHANPAPCCTFIDSFLYSAHGEHFAYIAGIAGKEYVLLDHIPGMAFDDIRLRSLIFSPNGERLAYVAIRDNQQVLVEHQTSVETAYDAISQDTLRFSGDNAHLAYIVQDNGRWRLIVNGERGELYDDVGTPVFSPDSEHLAYRLRDGEKWRIMIDGRPASRPLDCVGDPQFTKGSSEVGYLAREGNRLRYVEVGRYR